MIITQLNGGIGNQMFQYAVGREVSLRHDVPLVLDIALCKRDPQRPYSLYHFTITGQLAEVRWTSDKLKSALGRVYKERFFQYDPSLTNCPDGMYLKGYWQSEKYFKDIENDNPERFHLFRRA